MNENSVYAFLTEFFLAIHICFIISWLMLQMTNIVCLKIRHQFLFNLYHYDTIHAFYDYTNFRMAAGIGIFLTFIGGLIRLLTAIPGISENMDRNTQGWLCFTAQLFSGKYKFHTLQYWIITSLCYVYYISFFQHFNLNKNGFSLYLHQSQIFFCGSFQGPYYFILQFEYNKMSDILQGNVNKSCLINYNNFPLDIVIAFLKKVIK